MPTEGSQEVVTMEFRNLPKQVQAELADHGERIREHPIIASYLDIEEVDSISFYNFVLEGLCQAYSLGQRDAAADGYVLVRMKRGHGPHSPVLGSLCSEALLAYRGRNDAYRQRERLMREGRGDGVEVLRILRDQERGQAKR